MNFKDSERPWLIGGVLGAVVLSAAAWFTVIGPEFANASTVRSQVGDAETQNTVLQARSNKLKEQSKQLPQLQQELAKKIDQLPTDAQFSQFTAQVNEQAAASGVLLTSIGATTPTSVNNSGAAASAAGQTFSISLTIQATGALTSLQHFLHLIQTEGPRAALISSASFNATAKNYNLNATMSVFTTPLTQAQANELQSELTAVAPGN